MAKLAAVLCNHTVKYHTWVLITCRVPLELLGPKAPNDSRASHLGSKYSLFSHLLLLRKDFELDQLQAKMEDEQSVAAQLHKRMKELQVGLRTGIMLLTDLPPHWCCFSML